MGIGENLNGIYALLRETPFANAPKTKTQKRAKLEGEGQIAFVRFVRYWTSEDGDDHRIFLNQQVVFFLS